MARMIVLLLGSLFIFASPTLIPEKMPATAKFKAKFIQWVAREGGLTIISETGEHYYIHLGSLLPTMEKTNTSTENEHRLLLFPYAYEAVLQQRFIAMLSHQIAFSTNKYDRRQQDQGDKKEDRPKRLEIFSWDASVDRLLVEITPGVSKNGAIFPLNEKLKYSFDLKNDVISEGFLFPRLGLDENDSEMIKNFLAFLAVYVRESIEWYEVETSRGLKSPAIPRKEKNNTVANFFAGNFYPHPVF